MSLEAGVVRVRSIDLTRAPALDRDTLHRLAGILDESERARAARFAFAADRARFIVARAALRQTLAPLVGVAPAALRYELGPFGKPAIARSLLGERRLFFNLSNTPTIALVAWAPFEVGIDVEDIEGVRPVDELDVAGVVFSPRERQELSTLPAGPVRRSAFYGLWVRKEAILKALGTGFSRPANEIDLGLHPDGSGPWRWTDPTSGDEFGVVDLQPISPHRAAIAARAASFTVAVSSLRGD